MHWRRCLGGCLTMIQEQSSLWRGLLLQTPWGLPARDSYTCFLQGSWENKHVFLWLLALIASLLLQEKMVSYPKLDFSVQELQERFQQQLEMELNNTITIESVESAKPLTPQAIKAVKLGVWGLHVWREGGQFSPQDQWERGRDRGPKKGGSSLVTQSHHSITVLLPFLCSANCWPPFVPGGMTPSSRP